MCCQQPKHVTRRILFASFHLIIIVVIIIAIVITIAILINNVITIIIISQGACQMCCQLSEYVTLRILVFFPLHLVTRTHFLHYLNITLICFKLFINHLFRCLPDLYDRR